MAIVELLRAGEPFFATPDVALVPHLFDERDIPVVTEEDGDADAVLNDPPEDEPQPEKEKPDTAVLAAFLTELHLRTSAPRTLSIHV